MYHWILTFVFSLVQHKRRYEWYFNGCVKDQDQNNPIPCDFKKTIVQDNSVPHLIGNLIFVAFVLRPPSLKRRHNLKEHKIKSCNLGVNKVYVAMYVCMYIKNKLSVIKIKQASRHIHEKLLRSENLPERLLKTDSESWKCDSLLAFTQAPSCIHKELNISLYSFWKYNHIEKPSKLDATLFSKNILTWETRKLKRKCLSLTIPNTCVCSTGTLLLCDIKNMLAATKCSLVDRSRHAGHSATRVRLHDLYWNCKCGFRRIRCQDWTDYVRVVGGVMYGWR